MNTRWSFSSSPPSSQWMGGAAGAVTGGCGAVSGTSRSLLTAARCSARNTYNMDDLVVEVCGENGALYKVCIRRSIRRAACGCGASGDDVNKIRARSSRLDCALVVCRQLQRGRHGDAFGAGRE